MSHFNGLDLAGILLLPIPGLVYWFILRSQHKHLTDQNVLVCVFMTRAASLIPIFAGLIFFGLILPGAFAGLRVIQSIFEAYAVYAFFAALVVNCGGPSNVAQLLKDSQIPLVCLRRQNDSPEQVYSRIRFSMWQFLWIRPVILFIGAICSYSDSQPLYTTCTFFAVFSTLYMVPGLITATRVLYDECDGLKVALKFVVIKISVGAILIEDAVQSILYSTGAISISDDIGMDYYSEEDKFVRIYCVIALCECALLSIVLYYGFSPQLIASEKAVKINEYELRDSTEEAENEARISWLSFVQMLTNLLRWSVGSHLKYNTGYKGDLRDKLVES